MSKEVKQPIILGAGLVGTLMSVYLARRGYKVKLLEKRSDPRKKGAERGRSINLALSNRGWRSLAEVGLENEIREMVIPMRGRMMHDLQGHLNFQPYGKEGQAINSISRSGLNELLLNTAEKEGVELFFDHICLDLDFEGSRVKLATAGREKEITGNLIIGADGAFSAVRTALMKTDRFNYSQYYLEHGYKELTMPAGADGGFQMEKYALHIWPRGNFMLIALPNLDSSYTCTLFFPFEGEPSFSSLQSKGEVLKFFGSTFPDAVPLLPQLGEHYFENPSSSLVTVRCFPWVKNRTLVIGDASHAIVPFYGQGMNAGFEDCRVLNTMIDEFDGDWDLILPQFQERRKPDADAIADLALQNFIEMRDLVGDENFLLRKKIEARLHDLFPDRWIPQYSMVTFNENIRYSEALEMGNKQRAIMDEVMQQPGIERSWEEIDFEGILDQLGG